MGWESDSMLNLTRMLGLSEPGSSKLDSVREEFEAMLDRFPVRACIHLDALLGFESRTPACNLAGVDKERE